MEATLAPLRELFLRKPYDPKEHCGGCSKDVPQTATSNKSNFSTRSRLKTPKQPTQPPKKISSSNMLLGINFLEEGNPNADPKSRLIKYSEGAGTSFAAHLLRKSEPLVSRSLHNKLTFKRDSNPEEPIINQSIIEQEDIFEMPTHFNPNPPPKCPPFLDKSLFTTHKFARDVVSKDLKYLRGINVPQQRPLSRMEDPLKKEVTDLCGRKTHDPKLRARDQCKRLCEVPSMTKELDHLYKEYMERCDGNLQNEACRFLYHVPSSTRQPRRSILKDHLSGQELYRKKSAALPSTHVQFDKAVEVISAITKVKGMDASLRQNQRMKLLRQIRQKRDLRPDTIEEKYPLHSKDPKKAVNQIYFYHNRQLSGQGQIDDEDLEEKTAKQDLARIYFTTEAARLVACSNLGTLDRAVLRKKMIKRQPLPRLQMERLPEVQEGVRKKKVEEKISAINNEMDAFDNKMEQRRQVRKPGDLNEEPPSEKSFSDLKLKVEILRKQKERDVLSAAERNRFRKSAFRQMLPSLADSICGDLLDYSLKRASRVSQEELALSTASLGITNQKNIFEEHQVNEFNKGLVSDLLGGVLDVVDKICHYRSANGVHPGESLVQKFINTFQEFKNDHEHIFLEYRFNEIKGQCETWRKGLDKPSCVYTSLEKTGEPFGSPFFKGKKRCPTNILDPKIPRPRFGLRIEKLIHTAEQIKNEKLDCDETPPKVEKREETPQVQTCSEIFQGKPKKRPSWKDEIAEYDCRQRERERKLLEEKKEEEEATLGFEEYFDKQDAFQSEKDEEEEALLELARKTKVCESIPGEEDCLGLLGFQFGDENYEECVGEDGEAHECEEVEEEELKCPTASSSDNLCVDSDGLLECCCGVIPGEEGSDWNPSCENLFDRSKIVEVAKKRMECPTVDDECGLGSVRTPSPDDDFFLICTQPPVDKIDCAGKRWRCFENDEMEEDDLECVIAQYIEGDQDYYLTRDSTIQL
ncbi:unnamed protein product [Orchesella dallaii]|uniref:Uncharacterized protein n=1 Tax=Orchesella dallaii TaxID=48710 RepID=A0ABP1QQ47_9HEXA